MDESDADLSQADDPFDSVAIYELVASLSLRDYDDLLASHWAVPDRPGPRERFDPKRFVRPEHRALVSLPPAPAGGSLDDTARSRAATVFVRPPAGPPPAIHDFAPTPDHAPQPSVRERLLRVMRWWQSHLLAHLRRGNS